MIETQDGILAAVPPLSRYLGFALHPGADLRRVLRALCEVADGRQLVVGLGASLVGALGRDIAGLRSFAGMVGAGVDVPATPQAVWCTSHARCRPRSTARWCSSKWSMVFATTADST